MNSEQPDIDNEVISEVLERVLEAEQEKLHLKNPRNIRNDIEEIVRDEVE